MRRPSFKAPERQGRVGCPLPACHGRALQHWQNPQCRFWLTVEATKQACQGGRRQRLSPASNAFQRPSNYRMLLPTDLPTQENYLPTPQKQPSNGPPTLPTRVLPTPLYPPSVGNRGFRRLAVARTAPVPTYYGKADAKPSSLVTEADIVKNSSKSARAQLHPRTRPRRGHCGANFSAALAANPHPWCEFATRCGFPHPGADLPITMLPVGNIWRGPSPLGIPTPVGIWRGLAALDPCRSAWMLAVRLYSPAQVMTYVIASYLADRPSPDML